MQQVESHYRSPSQTTVRTATAGAGKIATAIMILAGIALSLQITLTRLFSLIFQYNFVFLVISLAVLGLGLGAALGYGAQQLMMVRQNPVVTSNTTLVLALVLPLTAVLLANLDSGELTLAPIIASSLPFLLIGWITSLLYSQYAEKSNLLYGADLIGAALGIVASVGLLVLFGPFTTIILCGPAAGLAAALISSTDGGNAVKLKLSVGIAALLLLLGIANHLSGAVGYHPRNLTAAPPDKTLVHMLRNPRLEAEVIATDWGAFAQVDVVKTNDPAARFVFTDGGAGSIMLRFDRDIDLSNYRWIEREVPYLPFTTGPVDKTLIIGAGAGYDVFMAKYAGATSIAAVEINPAIVKATRDSADYNGNILDDPVVTTIVTDGRNYAGRSRETYDLIYLNVVYSQAAAPTSAVLAENYAFTVEAFRSYWRRLRDEGRLAIVGHNGIEGVRLLMTSLAALQAEGLSLQEALSHTALVMSDPSQDPNTAPSVLLVTRQVWTEDSAAALASTVSRRQLMPLFIPHVFEGPLSILRRGSMTFDEYLRANTDFNIFPTSDDQPFFYHLTTGLPQALVWLLEASLALTIGFLILATVSRPKGRRRAWWRINLLIYFALLGTAYLLAEIAVQKRFDLLLGNPVLSLMVTLGALLLGSGAGSLFGRRFTPEQLPRAVIVTALTITLWLAGSVVVYPALITASLPLTLAGRILMTLIALLPLGFLMGIPFPSGLRLAGTADGTGVPLYWGINAITSTLGAVLATVTGLLIGFHMVLLIGAALYLLAAVLVWLTWPGMVRNAVEG